MYTRLKWFVGAAAASGLLVGSIAATGASAQTTRPGAGPGSGYGACPGIGMMTGAYGPRATFGPTAEHDAIASALGISSQDLSAARAAGKSVADLAKENNIDLNNVVDAALAVHASQINAAVQAGTLTQTQADAMTALMRSRIEAQFQATTLVSPFGPGMMAGRGRMGPGFGPGFGWRGAP